MIKPMLKVGILVAAGVSCLLAANPAGTITSAGDFDLSGTRVPVAAVPAWPVVAGDQIVTYNSPASLTMRDGSKFMLQPNSTVRIEQNGSKFRVRLVKGDFKYTLSSKSQTEVVNYASVPANFPAATASAGSKSASANAAANASSQTALEFAPAFAIPPPRLEANISPAQLAPGVQLGRPPISAFRP